MDNDQIKEYGYFCHGRYKNAETGEEIILSAGNLDKNAKILKDGRVIGAIDRAEVERNWKFIAKS